jgi:RNase P/RNase MRP subunit POP5
MKPLKPAHKENKRYLLIRGKNLRKNVTSSIKDFIGVLGMSKTALSWIEEKENSGIICINRESLEYVRASFAVWEEKIEILKVSGTLKGLRK